MLDANTFYLNEHLNKEAEKDRQRDEADIDTVRIFNQLIAELHLDSSPTPKTEGWNMFGEVASIDEEFWVPLARAFQKNDKAEIGQILYDAVTKNLMKDAKYKAFERLEEGYYK